MTLRLSVDAACRTAVLVEIISSERRLGADDAVSAIGYDTKHRLNCGYGRHIPHSAFNPEHAISEEVTQ
jgi:hypothetical protein